MHFAFRSMIHFELLLLLLLLLLFLHVVVQLFQNHLLKRVSFLHGITFAPLSKSSRWYSQGPVSGLSILSLVYPTVPSLTPHGFDYLSFLVSLEEQHRCSGFDFLLLY